LNDVQSGTFSKSGNADLRAAISSAVTTVTLLATSSGVGMRVAVTTTACARSLGGEGRAEWNQYAM
jgi:hypothetical protein